MGDLPGHPFRGNQYKEVTTGEVVGGNPARVRDMGNWGRPARDVDFSVGPGKSHYSLSNTGTGEPNISLQIGATRDKAATLAMTDRMVEHAAALGLKKIRLATEEHWQPHEDDEDAEEIETRRGWNREDVALAKMLKAERPGVVAERSYGQGPETRSHIDVAAYLRARQASPDLAHLARENKIPAKIGRTVGKGTEFMKGAKSAKATTPKTAEEIQTRQRQTAGEWTPAERAALVARAKARRK